MKKILALLAINVIMAFAYKNIDNNELEQLVGEGAVIVDVRLEEEWRESGIVQGSQLVTYFDRFNQPLMKEFLNYMRANSSDKNRPIIVVCRSGQRSIVASQALDKAGYKNVYNLKYGILGWLYEKRRLVKYPAK